MDNTREKNNIINNENKEMSNEKSLCLSKSDIIEIMREFNKLELASFSMKKNKLEIKMKKAEAFFNSQSSIANFSYVPENVLNQKDEFNRELKTEDISYEKSGKENLKENFVEIKTPIVGTFYSAPSPESKPFVSVGDRVSKGDVVALVEAMKMMNEIKATCSGVVKNILVENEDVVSYSQVLMEIEEA